MTLRRLLLIIDGMDPFNSRFYAEVNGFDFIPMDTRVQTDIFGMFSEKPHPIRSWREDMRREREKAMKKAAIKRAMKERARRLNS